jgi:hypothetical protein
VIEIITKYAVPLYRYAMSKASKINDLQTPIFWNLRPFCGFVDHCYSISIKQAREETQVTLIDRIWEMEVEGGLTVADREKIVDALRDHDALRAMVKELADDLEAEIEGHYANLKDHPAMTPKYERDMEPVRKARQLLG